MWETWVWSLVWEAPLGKGKATHSSILAWRIPGENSMGLQRVGHDQATFISLHLGAWGFAGSSAAKESTGKAGESPWTEKPWQATAPGVTESDRAGRISTAAPGSLAGYSPWGCRVGQEVASVQLTQLCPTLWNPMDYSPSGSSVCGILQARVVEWVAIYFLRGSSWPWDGTQVSCTIGRYFTIWATEEQGGSD